MTRACPSISRPASPKSKPNGEQQLRMPLEGGVLKRHPSSPARTAFKSTLAKSGPLKADGIVAQLKSLLPNAKHEKETSERDLVEETISYIAYLEGILQMANEKDERVTSAVDMLKSMKF